VLRLVAAFLLFVLAASAARAEPEQRWTWPLDAGWRLHKGEVAGAWREDFDAKDWLNVTLPYTFNAGDGEDGGGYYRGPAWYRRELNLPAAPAGARLLLQFEGAALAAEVYVNGRPAGRHEGGYAGFRLDVTDAVRAGTNVVAVRVDNSAGETIAPLGGDFTVFGGLYRRVSLLSVPVVHVDALDHGGPGVRATVARVSPERAELAVTVPVRNAGRTTTQAAVTIRVLDAGGKEVARAASTVRAPAGQVRPVSQTLVLASPRLWQGRRDPYLYRVVAEVASPGGSDRVEIPLGVRTFAVDPDRGFLLNGQPLPLRGVNYFHAGRPGKGLAVTEAEIDEDFAILAALGANAVRFVHFQHPQRAYELADRLGFVVWTEVPLNARVSREPAFEANLLQQMRELIRQNAQHPSVAFWGLGNEVYQSDETSNRLLAELQKTARAEDPSRLTVYAHCCADDLAPHALHADVGAYNKYFGWYPDQVGDIGQWADRLHARAPQRAFAVSEYGAGGSVLHQEDPPRRPSPAGGWHPEQYQAQFHEDAETTLATRGYLWGRFIWVAFDLASDGRNEGDRPGINDKGLVTYDRTIRKDAYYWQQANWSDAPMVRIASRRMTPRREASVDVKVYSNAARVRLTVNGADLGDREVVGRKAVWTGVALRPGANMLRATAEAGGRRVSDEIAWSYEVAPQAPTLEEGKWLRGGELGVVPPAKSVVVPELK